jgi:co-chaperonin GroES (HSP10)
MSATTNVAVDDSRVEKVVLPAPCNGHLLVEKIEHEATTVGGLELPETLTHGSLARFVVVATSEDWFDGFNDGLRRTSSFEPGNVVLADGNVSYHATIVVGGKTFYFLTEDQINGVYR